MMPTADATAVSYSHLLDWMGGPRMHAHALFEESLDAEPAKPAAEMTVDEKRALLRQSLQAQGRDASQLMAGAE